MVRLERGFVTGLSCAASACARARGCCACTHGLTPLAVYIYILLIVRVGRVRITANLGTIFLPPERQNASTSTLRILTG